MTPDVSFPLLVIPADTATDLVRTMPCGWCIDPSWELGDVSDYGDCENCGNTRRVPDPEAPRRLVLDERPVVPCPHETYDEEPGAAFDHPCCRCVECSERFGCEPGVVPLVGGETVALAVAASAAVDNSRFARTGHGPVAATRYDLGQVLVAVAQVADVIEEVRVRLPGEPWFPWRRAAPGGRQNYEHLDVERRWVVVLGRVDPCEEER